MQKYTMKDNVISALMGAVAAIALAILLHPLYEHEQEERRRLEAEWVREQIEADRAYQAEVEAERQRWEEIEAEEEKIQQAEIAYATEMEKINFYYNPEIPDEVEDAARIYGEEYGLGQEFLEAVAKRESGFDPEAENGGCKGLMQISTYWHRDRMARLEVTDIWDVDGNMHVGADYLAELFAKHPDPVWVLMAYNGDSNADAYLRGEAQPSGYALDILRYEEEFIAAREGGEAIEH